MTKLLVLEKHLSTFNLFINHKINMTAVLKLKILAKHLHDF